MISRGVEISIAGGGGAMVREKGENRKPSALYRPLPTTLSLMTHKPSHVLKRVTCVKPMTHNVSHVRKSLHHMTSQS